MTLVLLKTLSGRTITQTVEPDTTCTELKSLAAQKLTLPEDDLTLFYGIKMLENDCIISKLGVPKNSFITIHQKESFNAPYIQEQKTKIYPRASGKMQSYEEKYGGFVRKDKIVIAEPTRKLEPVNLIAGDPYDFHLIVNRIMEMGFKKDAVINSLRKYKYNQSLTVEFLLSGVDPSPQPRVVEHDVSGLARYNFGDFAGIVDDLTNHQKHDLLRLLGNHSNTDAGEILQIFMACDMVLEAAEHALM
jgi:hypothetical protein